MPFFPLERSLTAKSDTDCTFLAVEHLLARSTVAVDELDHQEDERSCESQWKQHLAVSPIHQATDEAGELECEQGERDARRDDLDELDLLSNHESVVQLEYDLRGVFQDRKLQVHLSSALVAVERVKVWFVANVVMDDVREPNDHRDAPGFAQPVVDVGLVFELWIVAPLDLEDKPRDVGYEAQRKEDSKGGTEEANCPVPQLSRVERHGGDGEDVRDDVRPDSNHAEDDPGRLAADSEAVEPLSELSVALVESVVLASHSVDHLWLPGDLVDRDLRVPPQSVVKVPAERDQLALFLKESELGRLILVDKLVIRVRLIELVASLSLILPVRLEVTQGTLVELLDKSHLG